MNLCPTTGEITELCRVQNLTDKLLNKVTVSNTINEFNNYPDVVVMLGDQCIHDDEIIDILVQLKNEQNK